jgi:hypothetical protein
MAIKMLALCLLAGLANSIPIGLQGGLSAAALDNFKDKALPEIIDSIGTQELPPISKTVGSKVLPVKVDVHELVVQDIWVNTHSSTIALCPPDLIEVQLKEVTGTVAFKWGFSTSIAEDTGMGLLTLRDTKATMAIRLSEHDLRLRVTVEKASVSIGDVHIEFTGNPTAEAVKFVLKVFKDEIENSLSKHLTVSLANATQSFLDKLLGDVPLVIPLGPALGMNYSLPISPSVSLDYLELYSLGVIVDLTNPEPNPPHLEASLLPHFDIVKEQVQVAVSEFTVNSGLYAGVRLIQFTVTDDEVIQLNTSILKFILPGIAKKYQEDQSCQLICKAKEYPEVSFIPDSIQGTTTFLCDVKVVGVEEPVVSLEISSAFSGAVYLEDWKLQGSITAIEILALKVKHITEDVSCNTGSLQLYLGSLLNLNLHKIERAVFGGGLELPTVRGVVMTEGSVSIGEHYLLVEGSPEYNFTHRLVVP